MKKLSTSLLLALSLAGCSPKPIATAPEVTPPERFASLPAGASADLQRWWAVWQDPVLNQLLERGLAQNFEIRAARSRWEEARQLAGLASADRGASVGASAKGSYTLAGRMENPLNAQSRAQLAQNPNTAALAAPHFDMNDGNNIQLGLSASWEPDFFGRKSSDEDAARAGAAAAAAQYRGAQLLTAAAIVDGYLQARALQARQRLHEAHLATLKRLQHYVAGRYQAGQTSAYELNDIDSKISALNAKGALLHSDYERQVRALAVLTGRRPTDFQLAEGRADLFSRQPAAPAGALPSSLLERRPDLLAKAALVKARAAQVASAQADFLPRFTLEFSLPFLSINGSSHAQGWASMVNANLQTPLFTNGRLDRQLGAAEARLRTARLDYDQTLLQALADVDNAHQAHRALERQNELLAAAQTAALRQAEDGEALFKYGHKNLDEALRARLNEQELAENLLSAQLARAQTLTALYKALGGGWGD